METLTYHGLGLGLAVTRQSERVKNPRANTDVFNFGVTTVWSYLLQGLLGLAVTLGLFYAMGNWPFKPAAAHGLRAGAGQAYNWGHIYETATANDLRAVSIRQQLWTHSGRDGLRAASVGGVIYLHG